MRKKSKTTEPLKVNMKFDQAMKLVSKIKPSVRKPAKPKKNTSHLQSA